MSGKGKSRNAGQFRKGRSGNPKGRPRKMIPEGSAIDVLLDDRIPMTREGVEWEAIVDEALQQTILQEALAGKRQAQRQVLKWIKQREKWRAKNGPKPEPPKNKFAFMRDPENAKPALEILGIVSCDAAWDETDKYYPRQKLEPWAVQAALNRRRGRSALTEDEVRDIKRSARDPDLIRWPKGSRG